MFTLPLTLLMIKYLKEYGTCFGQVDKVDNGIEIQLLQFVI